MSSRRFSSKAGISLFVPPGLKPRQKLNRVLVAWTDTREASRAIAEALPFLRAASNAEIVVVDAAARSETRGYNAVDIAAHLDRQGVKVAIRPVDKGKQSVSEALLERLVGGARTLSSWAPMAIRAGANRSWALRREILASAKVPILMAHRASEGRCRGCMERPCPISPIQPFHRRSGIISGSCPSNLSLGLQRRFEAHAADPRREEAAHRIAWAAVKRSMKKSATAGSVRASAIIEDARNVAGPQLLSASKPTPRGIQNHLCLISGGAQAGDAGSDERSRRAQRDISTQGSSWLPGASW